MTLLTVVLALVGLYLMISLVLSYVVQQYPRHPVVDPPDWGVIEDLQLSAAMAGLSRSGGSNRMALHAAPSFSCTAGVVTGIAWWAEPDCLRNGGLRPLF